MVWSSNAAEIDPVRFGQLENVGALFVAEIDS